MSSAIFSSDTSNHSVPVPNEADPQLLKSPLPEDDESSDSELVGIPKFEADIDEDDEDSKTQSSEIDEENVNVNGTVSSQYDEDESEDEEEFQSSDSISLGSTGSD